MRDYTVSIPKENLERKNSLMLITTSSAVIRTSKTGKLADTDHLVVIFQMLGYLTHLSVVLLVKVVMNSHYFNNQ